MENADPSDHSKKSLGRSSNSHISLSDTESTTSQVDSWHSPLRSESPLRSDDPSFRPEKDDSGVNSGKSLVLVDKYNSPVPASSEAIGRKGMRPWPHSEKHASEHIDLREDPPLEVGNGGRTDQYSPAEKRVPENVDTPPKAPSPVVLGVNKMVREEPPAGMKKIGPLGDDGGGLEEGRRGRGRGRGRRGYEDEVGGDTQSRAAVASILKRSEMNMVVKKAAMALRLFEVVACLISFSVMAADKTQGWSGDSFDRYKEYRYCLSINVIGFVYAAFQAFDLAKHLRTGRHIFAHPLRFHFDFAMDQILAYLLMSASSSAATRVDDWVSNWGGDEFTLMASASIAMSFLAFIAFASSSLISGYNLCNHDST
ncbi:CASP-like protein 4A3 [Andrographis paniculata]|uniref:CASP-like protein 4A3 n=1 Tax=Andrographis paniculata TaxID=175694 RepID=UPI0021E8B99C|nr:CASP-like protein 4A3 [Andrographis paniculata]